MANVLGAQLAGFANQAMSLLFGGVTGQPTPGRVPRAEPAGALGSLGGLGGIITGIFDAFRSIGGGGAGPAGAAGARPQSFLDALLGRLLPGLRGGAGQPQAPAPGGVLVGGGAGAGAGAGGVVAGGGAVDGAAGGAGAIDPPREPNAPQGDGVRYETARIATSGQGGGQADARGNLYVASDRDVKIFDTNQRQIGGFSVPEGALDVAPAPDGRSAFVVSRIGNVYQTRKFAQQPNGTWQLDRNFRLEPFEFGGQMRNAEGMRIATDQLGDLYVADGMWTSNSLNTVAKFDANGRFITRFGSFVDGNPGDASSWEQGRFYWGLAGVAAAPDGSSVYTTEVGNNRVQRWDQQPDGTYAPAAMWGSTQETDPDRAGGSAPGELAAPYDVGVDARGEVYVMNTSASQVQRFTRDGDYLGSIDVHKETDPRRREVERTHGIAVDADGDVVSIESGVVARRR